MLNLRQSGKGTLKGTVRLRLSALLCLLLLLGASTAEVAHHHPGDFPAQKNTLSQQNQLNQTGQQDSQKKKSSETLCPLCIAMHGVLPVAAPAAPAPVAVVVETPQAAASSHYSSLWSFELFGRPPPVSVVAHV